MANYLSNPVEYLPSQQLLELLLETKGNTWLDSRLESTISALAAGVVPEERVTKWLKSCRANIMFLGKNAQRFVYTFLNTISWIKTEDCLKEYCKFVTNIVSAFPSLYTEPTLKILIGLFSSVPPDEANLIHVLINDILIIVPLSKTIILRQVALQFPYIKIESLKQENYVANVFHLIELDDSWRGKLLEILLSKVLVLDVNVPREDILESEEDDEDEGDEGVFGMDVDEDQASSSCEKCMKNPMADSLDRILYLVFTYIQWHREQSECDGDRTADNALSEAHKDGTTSQRNADELLSLFSSVILMSHCCSHLQYVAFYVSAVDTGFRERLLKLLWETVHSPSALSSVRENAAAYMGSLLARATFIDRRTCLQWMGRIGVSLHKYLKAHSNGGLDTTVHIKFYALCQALFYVFAFRHKELVSSKEALSHIQRIDFQTLVGCKLNPLKVINPAVVSKFASITRTYQICYCYTYIERNERRVLPSVRLIDGKLQRVEMKVLSSFFPFEPYLLKRSHHFIKPFYREYKSDDHDESLLTKQEQADVEDDDDFLDDKVKKEEERMSTSWTDVLGHSKPPGFNIYGLDQG